MTSTELDARSKARRSRTSSQPNTQLPTTHPTSPPPPLPTSPSSATSTASALSPTAAAYASSVDPLRSLIVFVVGAPGSGKTTQCAALAQQFDCHHIVFEEYVKQAHTVRAHQVGVQAALARTSHCRPLPLLRLPTARLRRPPHSCQASNRRYRPLRSPLSSRSTTSVASSSSSKQPLPSVLRSRLLYQAMQYLSVQQPLFRFLVDGYLDSEDDWNEWAALVSKRKAERDEATLGQDGKRGSHAASAVVIGFLPPIILRLVCSESVGQLRWRRALLLQRDQLTSTAALPSSAEVKARSMRYSLRTRPMIYRLGMVAEELMARKGDGAQGDAEDDEDEEADDDDLTAMDGMIVKRVDAEGPIEQCYSDMQQLMEQIVRNTRDDDWTRITGYNSEDEDGRSNQQSRISNHRSHNHIHLVVDTTQAEQQTASELLEVPAEAVEESPSPDAVNWEEDPDEAKEREEPRTGREGSVRALRAHAATHRG